MKFHLVKIGQEFLYKDESYIKTSPLVASHKSEGGQKLFRRADEVSLCTAAVVIKDESDVSTIDISILNDLLDGFVNECELGLQSLGEDFSQIHRKKILNTITQSKQRLLTKINSKSQ